MTLADTMGGGLRLLPPETAHSIAIRALRCGLVAPVSVQIPTSLTQKLFGLTFTGPLGLAAGFDKNAEAIDALLGLGFGHVEAGTVTPLPQPGNPKPRLFRLSAEEAIINRLGFNNDGVHRFAENLRKRKRPGIVGANIGKNKDSLDAVYDYGSAMAAVYAHADYITINISSPNTVGLRDLQRKEALNQLMQEMALRQRDLANEHGARKPVLYKIAPDLTTQDKEDIVAAALEHKVDGLIVSNTTITRPDSLASIHKNERGGLSGKPLLTLSTETLRDIYRLSSGKIPLIGVGGIASARDAYVKIKAGASLVQLYTAIIYQGFGLIPRINTGLAELLAQDGFTRLSDAVGVEAR